MDISIIAILVSVSITVVILLTSTFRLNAFISLFLASLFLAVTALPHRDIIKIMQEGFGSTMGSIGFLIILGAIIAVILDRTGGALSIARFILSKTGEKKCYHRPGSHRVYCGDAHILRLGIYHPERPG